jgi:hypothetical protein
MRRLLISLPLGLGLALALLLAAPVASSTGNEANRSSAPHVMVIIEENRNRDKVIGASDMPYFNSLASKYTDTTSWEGVGHPSLPNYLALISGSTQGVTEDVTGISFPGVPTLGSQLSEAGIPWKAYMEDMPEVASEVAGSGKYAKKHNPFAYFPGTNGPNVVPASEFVPDLAEGKLPPFVWYTPNLINDGHDGTNADVDSSLKSIVPAVQASAWYKEGGIIIITWDESNTEPDVIPTVVVSGEGSGTSFTAKGNHYGTLAAIEDLYGLPLLGNAAHATPLLIPGTTGKEATPPTLEAKAASLLTQTSATLNGADQTLTTLAGQGGSQEQKTPPIPNAELASTSLTGSSSGTVSVKITCAGGESRCTGAVTLRTLNAVIASVTGHQSKKRKAAILTLAAGSFKVAGGHATTVKLHLSGKARTLLARTHVLHARATIVAHDPAGATHTTQTIVTIRAAKATHGHKS